MRSFDPDSERVVITGLGIATSVGSTREEVWQAVRHGQSGIGRIYGVLGIPDGLIPAAMIDLPEDPAHPGRLKTVPLCLQTAREAWSDAGIELSQCNPERVACYVSGHMGDSNYVVEKHHRWDLVAGSPQTWVQQWFPHEACSAVARELGLQGQMSTHSTACASGTIDLLGAVRAIRDGRCDLAVTGSAEAIHPLFAAGFRNMRVLADHEDPKQASRPFDAARSGFVMGEGAATFVLERLSHARRRGARIYAEVLTGHVLADARHLTGLEADSDTLVRLIEITLARAGFSPRDVGYVNAHGTGTEQNDVMETRGIRGAFGRAADRVAVSAHKSMLGHLVNASGSVETALTVLALRDGFIPPTINLTHPDPRCDLDYVPLVGRPYGGALALKLSIAFGGHMAAVLLRRWDAVSPRMAA
jgi:3-oxoacyl-(acyl-carrier-protein) synthase